MSAETLTRDKLQLTRPTMTQLRDGLSAINCIQFPDMVASYVNTRRAYLSDLGEFKRWGGSVPASPETVASYLAARAEALAVASARSGGVHSVSLFRDG
jgi:hypothetical protein